MTARVLDHPILFFGGKGGVGKTTLASACAYRSAKEGQDTLLVSTDPAHSTADLLGVELDNEPRSVTEHLWAMEIDPEAEADAYIATVKSHIEETTAPRLLGEVERQIDIARVSPGAEEAALFERFARILGDEGSRFARVVFDTAPTGHTLRLVSLPELMSTWMSGLVQRRKKVNVLNRMWRNVSGTTAGHAPREDPVLRALTERQQRFRHARTMLTDTKRTAFVFVLTPERLPILETVKAVRTLERYRIPVGGVILNRVLPPDAAGEFIERRRQREQQYLDDVTASFGDQVLWSVPLLTSDVVGLTGLEAVLDHIPMDWV